MGKTLKVKNNAPCIYCDKYMDCDTIYEYTKLVKEVKKVTPHIGATIDIKCNRFKRI